MPWQAPSLTVKWGPYQKPDGAEQAKIMELVQAGLGGTSGTRILTRELAIEKLRDGGVIETEDVAELIAKLDAEQAAADEHAVKNAKDLLVATAAVKPPAQAGAAGRGGAPAPRVPPK